MALPSVSKTWTLSANNRIAGAATNDLLSAAYLIAIKNILVAAGWTVRGSSNASSAAMDGVDRWVTTGNVTWSGSQTIAHSWIVLTDGNGSDILLDCSTASNGNQLRMNFSPTGLFILAGTPTFTPSATDSVGIFTVVDLCSTTPTSATDRLVNVWTSSDRKNFRVLGFASNAGVCGSIWGVGEITSSCQGSTTFSPNNGIFVYRASTLAVGTSTALFMTPTMGTGGWANRVAVLGTPTIINCGMSVETWASATSQHFQNLFTNLQNDNFVQPIRLSSNTAGGRGELGVVVDMWSSPSRTATAATAQAQFLVGNRRFIQVGNLLWPWDGSSPLTLC